MTAKRRATVDLAFARLPLAHLFDVVVGGDETERHKPDPAPLQLAPRAARRRAGGRRLRRRLALRHAGRARRRASTPSASPGAASTTVRRSPTPTSSSTPPRSFLPSSEPRARAASSVSSSTAGSTSTTCSTSRRSPTRRTTARYDELVALEEEHPELVTPDSPTQRVGAPAPRSSRRSRHLDADGLAREGDDDDAIAKWADDVRKRLDNDEPVAYVLEPKIDGLAINLTYEDGVFVRGATRGDGEVGRGRDRQPAHDPLDPAAAARRRRAGGWSRCAARSTCRSPGFSALNERLAGRARSSPRTRATRPPARCARRTPSITARRPLSVWAYGVGAHEGVELAFALADARVAEARTASRSTRSPSGVESIEAVAKACREWERKRTRARLRDRRHRDQGRRPRPAAPPRRAALAAALGARVQVGADDGDDAPEQDRDPRRPHGRPEPLGDARAGRGRRRHGLARDAAQRGGHQPQADPRGRRRDRPARRRRDPADRRAGGRAPAGDEASSACRRTARSAARRSSSPRARPCTAARTAPAPRAGSRR